MEYYFSVNRGKGTSSSYKLSVLTARNMPISFSLEKLFPDGYRIIRPKGTKSSRINAAYTAGEGVNDRYRISFEFPETQYVTEKPELDSLIRIKVV